MSAVQESHHDIGSESRLKVEPGTAEHRAQVQEMCAELIADEQFDLVARLLHDNFSNEQDESPVLRLAQRVLGDRIVTSPEIESGAFCAPTLPSFNRTMVQLPESYSPIQRVMTLAWAVGHYATRLDRFAPDDEAYAVGVELVAILYGREQATEWIAAMNAERPGRYPELMPEGEVAP